MRNHSFNTLAAKKYGVNAAIILQHICYWVSQNAANEKNYYDGQYWMYNSVSAFKELFPYLTKKQIRTALDKLKEHGAIKTGNYNKSPYDRTLWYTVAEESDYQELTTRSLKVKIDLPKVENRFAHEGEPIPDINTDIEPDIKKTNTKKEKKHTHKCTDKEFEEYWEKVPNKVNKKKAKQLYLRIPREKHPTILRALEEQKKTKGWQQGYIPHPTTWLNGERWEDQITPQFRSPPLSPSHKVYSPQDLNNLL